ncbi:MAG: RDD family protein [Nanoarchaeota archaeon]
MNLNLPKERVVKKDASIIKRFLALLIDILAINLFIISPFQKVFLKFFNQDASIMQNISLLESVSTTTLYITMFSVIVLALLYFALFEYKLSQTIGMMIMKIYVEGEISFWKAVIRNMFIIPFFPFYILWVVDPIHLFFRGKRFSEEMTKTRTVEIIKW